MNKIILTKQTVLGLGIWVLFYLNLSGCSEPNHQTPDIDKKPAIEKSIVDEDPFAQKDDPTEARYRLREDLMKPARIGVEEEV